MSHLSDDARQQIDRIRQRFIATVPDALESMRAAARKSDHSTLLGLVHRMAGSSGTFGLQQLSKLAMKLEKRLQQQTLPGDEVVDHIDAMVRVFDVEKDLE